jgi:DNA-binding SARP family transcriptional activator
MLSAAPLEELASADDSVPAISAHCLGKFELWLGHRLVSQWAGTKSKTLLKLMLASYPSPVPAAVLMEALWSGVENELARQRLHTAISDLRRALRAVQPDAGELVISQSGSYGLNPTVRIRIDIAEFDRLRRAGQQYEQHGRVEEAQVAYRRAVELYRGDYLEEDLYEDWPTERREKLRGDYVAMLTRLGQWAFNSGDYEACQSWGRLTLECDPSHEYTHRLLMRCACRLGQRAAAIRQYRQCVDALRRELDAMPEPETEELYERLRQGQEI